MDKSLWSRPEVAAADSVSAGWMISVERSRPRVVHGKSSCASDSKKISAVLVP